LGHCGDTALPTGWQKSHASMKNLKTIMIPGPSGNFSRSYLEHVSLRSRLSSPLKLTTDS